MATMATQNKYEMEAFSQKFATKTDANYLYTQIEKVQRLRKRFRSIDLSQQIV
jgi:hypothetical protein